MSCEPCSLAPGGPGDSSGTSVWAQWQRVLLWSRPRRVMLLLAGLWICNGFDLGFTLLAHHQGHFVEMNPVADFMLQGRRFWLLIVYKVGMVMFGSVLLWRYRHRWIAEVGAWGVAAIYAMLAVHWHDYYAQYLSLTESAGYLNAPA